MNLRIGDSIPFDYPRGITSGPEIFPEWYALRVRPMKERAVREYLRARDVYAFFPSEERSWRVQNRARKVTREFPIVTGIVYARFTQAPQWDVLKEQRRLITGVFSDGDKPLVLGREIVRRLQGLSVDAERWQEQMAELRKLKAGDRGIVTTGPLEGFLVDVRDVKRGQVFFSALGVKGQLPEAMIEKVAKGGGIG